MKRAPLSLGLKSRSAPTERSARMDSRKYIAMDVHPDSCGCEFVVRSPQESTNVELAGSLLALVDGLETQAGCESAVISPFKPAWSPSLGERNLTGAVGGPRPVKRSAEEGRATVSESKREQARRMMNESHREVFDDLARQELTKRPGQTAKELARSMGIEYDEI